MKQNPTIKSGEDLRMLLPIEPTLNEHRQESLWVILFYTCLSSNSQSSLTLTSSIRVGIFLIIFKIKSDTVATWLFFLKFSCILPFFRCGGKPQNFSLVLLRVLVSPASYAFLRTMLCGQLYNYS